MRPAGPENESSVIQQENNGFGPLFKRRGSNATTTYSAVLFLSLFILAVLSFLLEVEGYFYKLKFILSVSFVGFCIGEMIRRICLFTEEIRHVHSRYNGDWKEALKVTFTFANGGRFFILLPIAVWAMAQSLYSDSDILKYRSMWLIFLVTNAILLPCVSYLFGLNRPSLIEQSILNEEQNMNVADGLVWGYYFGYLKLVLPHVADQINKSQEFRDKIDVYKLFILMPKNCFAYPKLQDADSRISVLGNTPELRIDRGGIQGRVYKHSVHKIVIQNETYHCLVEYATPLMSLWDMSQNSEAGLGAKERDEQGKIFYAKLKDILDNCPSTRNKYCLIPFSGRQENVADIIVRAIKDEKTSIENM